MTSEIILTSPDGIITLGKITSFRAHPILHKRGSAKQKRVFSGTKIILEITLEKKARQALRKLRNSFGYHNVQRIGNNMLRITIRLNSKLYNASNYIEAKAIQIQNALSSSKQPKWNKTTKRKKGRYHSPHTQTLLASVARP